MIAVKLISGHFWKSDKYKNKLYPKQVPQIYKERDWGRLWQTFAYVPCLLVLLKM